MDFQEININNTILFIFTGQISQLRKKKKKKKKLISENSNISRMVNISIR